MPDKAVSCNIPPNSKLAPFMHNISVAEWEKEGKDYYEFITEVCRDMGIPYP